MKVVSDPAATVDGRAIENKGKGQTRIYSFKPGTSLADIKKQLDGDRKDQIVFQVREGVDTIYCVVEADDFAAESGRGFAEAGEIIEIEGKQGIVVAIDNDWSLLDIGGGGQDQRPSEKLTKLELETPKPSGTGLSARRSEAQSGPRARAKLLWDKTKRSRDRAGALVERLLREPPGRRRSVAGGAAFALPLSRCGAYAERLYQVLSERTDTQSALAWIAGLPRGAAERLRTGLERQRNLDGSDESAGSRLRDALDAEIRSQRYDRGLEALRRPEQHPETYQRLVQQAQSALGDPEGIALEHFDIPIKLKRSVPIGRQRLLDYKYSVGLDSQIAEYTKNPATIRGALSTPLARDKPSGAPAHIDGDTLVAVPGLGNAWPSIPWLMRMLQYADDDARMVVAMSWDDGTPASQLRKLEDEPAYHDVLRPLLDPETSPLSATERSKLERLSKRILVMGTAKHIFQTGVHSGALLAKQIDALHHQQSFELELDNLTLLPHSQGNVAATLASAFFASHGYPEVIDNIVGIAPATRGSFVPGLLEPVMRQVETMFGADVGLAVRHLAPEKLSQIFPEVFRDLVDRAYSGDVTSERFDGGDAGRIARGEQFDIVLMNLANELGRRMSSLPKGDGLVAGTPTFVRDQTHGLEIGPFDHSEIIINWKAVDAVVARIGDLSQDRSGEEIKMLLSRGVR